MLWLKSSTFLALLCGTAMMMRWRPSAESDTLFPGQVFIARDIKHSHILFSPPMTLAERAAFLVGSIWRH